MVKPYNEQIKSPKWQQKRLEILKLHNFTCELCVLYKAQEYKYFSDIVNILNDKLNVILNKNTNDILENQIREINNFLVFKMNFDVDILTF